jgi:gas vesicle protein
MPKENGESKGKVNLLAGLIGGVLAGAPAAMLLSPKTGKENRQRVREGIAKGKEGIAKGVEKIKNRKGSRDEEKF